MSAWSGQPTFKNSVRCSRPGSVVAELVLRVVAQVTLDGVTVTERALQSTLYSGFRSMSSSNELPWAVNGVTVSGQFRIKASVVCEKSRFVGQIGHAVGGNLVAVILQVTNVN